MESAVALEWVRGVGFPILVAWYILRHVMTTQSRNMEIHREELGKIRHLLIMLIERTDSHHEESRLSNRSGIPTPITSEKTPRTRVVKRAPTQSGE